MKKITLMLIACITTLVQAQNYVAIPDMGGATTVQAYCPFDMHYGHSRVATIYNKADIGGSGTIYKIAIISDFAATQTIPIAIQFKYSNASSWGGTGTFLNLSAGATVVYSGYTQITAGINYLTLLTPFNFTLNTNHLLVFFSMDYEGTGSPSPLKFICKPIDSEVDWLTLYWSYNDPDPGLYGQLIDYQPVMVLYFSAPTKPLSMMGSTSCSGNNLSWLQNAASDNVMVVGKKWTDVVNGPQCFGNYAAGDSLGYGSYVVYSGSATSALHGPLANSQSYYYKAWSYNANKIYSEITANSTILTPYNNPYIQDFDGGTGLPIGWVGTLVNEQNHGVVDNGLTAQLQAPNVQKSVSTPVFCNITANTILKFDYRIVNITDYPATATPAAQMDSITVRVSTDNGHNYTNVYSITKSNHIASTSFLTKQISLAAYAGQGVSIMFSCKRGTGEYFVDIDNFIIQDVAGIETSAVNNLQIYPTPAEEMITVAFEGEQALKSTINIINMSGQVLKTIEHNNSPSLTIDIKNLAKGIYLINVMSQGKNNFLKFVKM